MDHQEVLVHVTAPSRLRDDRRYQSLTYQLSNFEVAAVTHVYGFVGLTSKTMDLKSTMEANVSFYELVMKKSAPRGDLDRSTFIASSHIEVPRTSTTTKSANRSIGLISNSNAKRLSKSLSETPAQRIHRAACAEPDSSHQAGLKAKRLGQWQVMKPQQSVAIPHAHTTGPNPAYKNPFHGTKVSSQSTILALQTPPMVRPRTAPAGSIGTIQIASTLTAARKRSASDSFLDDSFAAASVVSDTQFHLQEGDDEAHENYEAYSPLQRQQQQAHAETTEAAENVSPESHTQAAKRRRLTSSNYAASIQAATARVNGVVQIMSIAARDQQVRPPYFLRDRSEDWTSPPEPSPSDPSSTTISSTLSPSQPLALRLSQTRNAQLPPPSLQPVDLTSTSPSPAYAVQEEDNIHHPSPRSQPRTHSSPRVSSDPFNSSPNSATRSFYHNSSPPVRFARGQKTPSARSSLTEAGRQCDVTSSIKSLPNRIEAPPPSTGTGSFVTHVSDALSIMINRLPLAKHFRPATVARDVRILERGHWSIRIKIASEQEVAEARRPPEQSEIVTALNEHLAGESFHQREARYESWKAAGENLSQLGFSKRCDLWTEAEFLNFWESLKSYVEDGKAGHGLSVAKDWAAEAVTPGRLTQSMYARIRVYTWGEVLGHIWVALWVLSDKKTAYIPMEWISTDDTVVVTMSGNRNKGGLLGPWIPKGSPGGKGSWGVAAGTPPSGQGKYVRLPNS
jgi:hypothetical protein